MIQHQSGQSQAMPVTIPESLVKHRGRKLEGNVEWDRLHPTRNIWNLYQSVQSPSLPYRKFCHQPCNMFQCWSTVYARLIFELFSCYRVS